MSSNLPLLNRLGVQRHVKHKYGLDYSPRTIESLPIFYRFIGRCALYDPKDVDEYFELLVSEAPRRIGGRARRASVPPDAKYGKTIGA
jgi:hypothetical protein